MNDESPKNKVRSTGAVDKSIASAFYEYAESLAESGKFPEAFSVYSLWARKSETVDTEIVRTLAQLMIAQHSRTQRKLNIAMDPWSCCACAGLLVDPITLNCGHSSCKKCIRKDLDESCKKCGSKYEARDPDPVNEEDVFKFQVNVLVQELVRKYWLKELKSVHLRTEGNKLFQRGQTEKSIELYSEAYAEVMDDHLLTSNRSHAWYKLGKFETALDDANKTIRIQPYWGKGYFRKGMALRALGRNSEALVTFFKCLFFEEKISKPLKTEIIETLVCLIGEEITPDKCADFTMASSELELIEAIQTYTKRQADREQPSKCFQNLPVPMNESITSILEEILESLSNLSTLDTKPNYRDIDLGKVNISDFECSLCFRMFWQPVTTACGHTYCRSCLDRSLDHRNECPLCKSELDVINRKLGVCEFVEETTRRMLSAEYRERQRIHEDEIAQLTGILRPDGRNEVPVFICTVSFPNIPCPLHVFEPRYRLMIRRAMESGTREFGMCINDPNNAFANYGTMLEIRDVQYFADGRSVVDTIGSRRFVVVERGCTDGYSTAIVEFLSDEIPEDQLLEELKAQHDATLKLAVDWFKDMDASVKENITSHYGEMPRVETEYWKTSSGPAWAWWVLAILPLDTTAQLQILSQVKLSRRLEAISRILSFISSADSQPEPNQPSS